MYSLKCLSEKNGENAQQGSEENGFTLCQILKAAKLKYDAVNFVYICVVFVPISVLMIMSFLCLAVSWISLKSCLSL